VAAAALEAVHTVVEADWAAIVRWKSDGPQVVFSSGAGVRLPPHRLPEGSVSLREHPAAVVAIDPSTDLIAARTASAAVFDPDDLRALRALALLASQAADPSRAAFTALYSVATKLLASRDLEEVLLGVANATAQVLRAEIGGIFLVDSSGRSLEMRSVVGHRTVDTARLRVKPGQGLAGKIFEMGVVHRVDDWTTDPSITKEFLTIASEEGTQSALGAPMATDAGRTALTVEDLADAAAQVLGERVPVSPDLLASMDPALVVATRTVAGGAAPERVREHAHSVRSTAAAAEAWASAQRAKAAETKRLLVATARRLAGQ
jgi:transcriptional regulator with GAF, ATPase, and Fis domain